MKRFTVRRILGRCDPWVTEFVLTYGGQPSYTVSIVEFTDGKVARENCGLFAAASRRVRV